MSAERQRYNPVPMAADASYIVRGPYIAGFLAVTGGTFTVTSKDALGTSDVTLVDEFPLTAGTYTPIPLLFPAFEGVVTLGDGASGTLFV